MKLPITYGGVRQPSWVNRTTSNRITELVSQFEFQGFKNLNDVKPVMYKLEYTPSYICDLQYTKTLYLGTNGGEYSFRTTFDSGNQAKTLISYPLVEQLELEKLDLYASQTTIGCLNILISLIPGLENCNIDTTNCPFISLQDVKTFIEANQLKFIALFSKFGFKVNHTEEILQLIGFRGIKGVGTNTVMYPVKKVILPFRISGVDNKRFFVEALCDDSTSDIDNRVLFSSSDMQQLFYYGIQFGFNKQILVKHTKIKDLLTQIEQKREELVALKLKSIVLNQNIQEEEILMKQQIKALEIRLKEATNPTDAYDASPN